MKHLLILFLIPLSSWSIAQQAEPSPSFLIEDIVVDGNRFTKPGIVLSASLLKPGKTYSENDLRDAVSRIERLVFVRSAEMALRKGSRRGHYVLVIEITELGPFFADFSTQWYASSEESTSSSSADRALLAARYFFGRDSMIFASVTPSWSWSDRDGNTGNTRYQAGYTSFDLFGQGIFFTLDAAFTPGEVLSSVIRREDIVTPRLSLSYPLGGNHYLRFRVSGTNYTDEAIDDPGVSYGRSDYRFRYTELGWERNNTDDSWFPMRGSLFAATFWQSDVEDTDSAVFDGNPVEQKTEDRLRELAFAYTRFQPFAPRQSWVLEGRFELRDGEVVRTGTFVNDRRSSESWLASIELGYRADFWQNRTNQRFGDLAFSVDAFFGWSETDSEPELSFVSRRSSAVLIEASLKYRSAWVALSASLRYTADQDTDLPDVMR